jgi:hypothetical protein
MKNFENKFPSALDSPVLEKRKKFENLIVSRLGAIIQILLPSEINGADGRWRVSRIIPSNRSHLQ